MTRNAISTLFDHAGSAVPTPAPTTAPARARRKEIRTVTRSTEVRIEFNGADLRKRLRLPEDAVLSVANVAIDCDVAMTATFTRTATKGA